MVVEAATEDKRIFDRFWTGFSAVATPGTHLRPVWDRFLGGVNAWYASPTGLGPVSRRRERRSRIRRLDGTFERTVLRALLWSAWTDAMIRAAQARNGARVARGFDVNER